MATLRTSHNYIHCKERNNIFKDCFGYVDTQDNKIISILNDNHINYRIKDRYVKLDNDYVFKFIECNLIDANKLRYSVFPQLEKRITKKRGNEYIEYCNQLFEKLENK